MLYIFFWVFDGYKIFLNLSVERPHCLHLYIFFFKKIYVLIFLGRDQGPGCQGEGEREKDIKLLFYLCIPWLFLVCSLTEDWTGYLGVYQLSYLVRASISKFSKVFFFSFLYYPYYFMFFPEMCCEFPYAYFYLCFPVSPLWT